jgi:hypothetical protein
MASWYFGTGDNGDGDYGPFLGLPPGLGGAMARTASVRREGAGGSGLRKEEGAPRKGEESFLVGAWEARPWRDKEVVAMAVFIATRWREREISGTGKEEHRRTVVRFAATCYLIRSPLSAFVRDCDVIPSSLHESVLHVVSFASEDVSEFFFRNFIGYVLSPKSDVFYCLQICTTQVRISLIQRSQGQYRRRYNIQTIVSQKQMFQKRTYIPA